MIRNMRSIKRVLMIVLCVLISTTAQAETVRISGNANVRSGPGLKYDAIDVVTPGETLEYMGESRNDDRGIAWYKVECEDKTGWISSKYGTLECGNYSAVTDTSAYIEVSDFFMDSLRETANSLGLKDYRDVSGSEIPHTYSNESLTIGGYDATEYFDLTGPGFTIYGAAVGMDKQTAKKTMIAAGLTSYDDSEEDYMWFDHPSSSKSPFDADGYDGSINLEMKNGIVVEISWCTYTG